MYTAEQKLHALAAGQATEALVTRFRGLEKESLRITREGHLALTPHPSQLGSPLTNGSITTDFSESLLEFITEPHESIEAALGELEVIHQFVYQQLEDELLWNFSMPCILEDEAQIPIAQYGLSNVAKMKTAYRVGLANRYGKAMQAIAGIHFNFSLSDTFFERFQKALGDTQSLQDFKTERYFSLIRSFHRWSWLLIYLFGASPAVCKCFVKNQAHGLTETADGDLIGEYATALRMGDLGYTSSAQDDLFVCYNELSSYIKTLHGSLTASYEPFEAMGVKDDSGEYRQLSTSILQIENEYYSSIRPKRTAMSGETPIKALASRGVEYIEVRCLDLNPFMALGTSANDLQFVEVFLIHCLMADDFVCDAAFLREGRENLKRTIQEGRKQGLALCDDGRSISLNAWGNTLFDGLIETAQRLDAAGDKGCEALVASYRARLEDPELTPSGQVLQALKEQEGGFSDLGLRLAKSHGDYFNAVEMDAVSFESLVARAKQSHHDQHNIEASDVVGFDEYLANYYKQYEELEL